MQVSYNWLKDYVDIELPVDELSHLLTMSGLEVEGQVPIGHVHEDVVAAKILSITKHPDADRLWVCQVDAGNSDVPVVCGATNLTEGAMVPLALPGVRLPGGMRIQETHIRGVRSMGMLLAEDEMGLTDDHTGIMILPSHLNPGDPIAATLGLADWTLEIGLTPNRPDCASVLGIAREIAALTGGAFKRPRIAYEESETPIDALSRVTIEDPLGCPRYAAGLIQGIAIKSSPFWLRYRLHVAGIRSINNVVDATNYVMMEMGQPLHAFDYDRLKENRIVVKRAKEGDTFTTLDGQTRQMNEEILMICDGERSVALAGIMGGLNSEIFAGSTNVLVESAYFDPITIRRGSKRLGLATEASYRFERGIDPEGVTSALKRSLMLIADLAGGNIANGIIDNYPSPPQRPSIDLRIDKTNAFLGTDISKETVADYLRALEMTVHEVDKNTFRVDPPSFRVDIEREVDLMEEVARLVGYDDIPVTYPAIRPSEEKEIPELVLREKIREIMVGYGFKEAITYSFISPESAEVLGAPEKSPIRFFVKLLNPLSVEQSVMRTSLVPGLLSTVRSNISHGEPDLKVFEWGKVFIRDGEEELPHERYAMAAMMTGLYGHKSWYADARPVDFYDIKGTIEGLLKSMGIRDFLFERGDLSPWYDADVSSGVYLSGVKVGEAGRVHEAVLERCDLKMESAFLFEIDIQSLMEKMPDRVRFEPFAKFPAVWRDISIVVKRQVESHWIKEIIRQEGNGLVESVHLFDLYEGGRLAFGEKALSFRICYRSNEGTLDGKEVNLLHDRIIEKIRQHTGGRLREG